MLEEIDNNLDEFLDLEIDLDEDIDLDLNDEVNIDFDDIKFILRPTKVPLKTAILNINVNGKDYKYYIFLKDEVFVNEYKGDILNNRNTLGYLYPTLDNVYNGKFLDEMQRKNNIEYKMTEEFTEEMNNSVKDDDDIYRYIKNYLKIFTLREGDKKVEI